MLVIPADMGRLCDGCGQSRSCRNKEVEWKQTQGSHATTDRPAAGSMHREPLRRKMDSWLGSCPRGLAQAAQMAELASSEV